MSDIELTHELLMPYQGLNGSEGLCHVRVYEALGWMPVVIVGGLDDNPGTAIALVIETVAAAVRRRLFADARQFHLIEHYRDPIDGLQTSRYALVRFRHAFRDPRWEPIDDIEELLGCKVAVWWPGCYTSRAVARRLLSTPNVYRLALQQPGLGEVA